MIDVTIPDRFTPGPWILDQVELSIHGQDGTFIATVELPPLCPSNVTDTMEANARLITAAPELLAACKHLLALLESPSPNRPGGVSRTILREAIAKAERGTE